MTNTLTIFQRELKSYFESPIAYVFLVSYLVLSGFMTFFVSEFYEQGQADLRMFFFWQPWIFLILAPAAAMRSWSEERRSGTIELLLTLPVTLTQAIVGKFLAAWLFLALAVALTFPIVITTLYLGDPDQGMMFSGYLGCLFLAATYLAVGTATSAMTRNQVISFVVALLVCMFLLLAGWPPVTNILDQWAPNWLVKGVAALGFMPHFEALQRGVVDLRDIVYFASVVGVLLFGTHLILQNRKSM